MGSDSRPEVLRDQLLVKQPAAPAVPDPVQERKLKAKLAQQRFKARKTAAETALVTRISTLQTEVGETRLKAHGARLLGSMHLDRLNHARAELAATRSELAEALAQGRRAPRPPVPEVVRTAEVRVAAAPRPLDGARALFEPASAQLPPLHTVPVSNARLGRESSFEALDAFRRSCAAGLGCGVDEVCWMHDLERYPELGAYSARLDSADSLQRFLGAWSAIAIERVAVLAILKRLEQLRDAHELHVAATYARPQPLRWPLGPITPTAALIAAHAPPGIALAPPLPQLPPPASSCPGVLQAASAAGGDGRGDSCIDGPHHACVPYVTWFLAASLEQLSLEGDAVRPPAGPGADVPAATCRLLVRIFSKYIPRIHPADAKTLCSSLIAMYAPQLAKAAAGEYRALIAVVHDVIKAAWMDVRAHPVVPAMPQTFEAVQLAVLEAESELRAVNMEMSLMRNLTVLDGTRVTYSIITGASPLAAGFDVYERLNADVFVGLALSKSQRQKLVCLWGAHMQTGRSLQLEKRGLLQRFSDLPSAPQLLAAAAPAAADPHVPAVLPEASCGGAAAGPPDAWVMRGILGASPEATEAAAGVLRGLRTLQSAQVTHHVRFRDHFMRILTPKQQALMLTKQAPTPDLYRLAVLACSSAVCDHAFGQPLVGAA